MQNFFTAKPSFAMRHAMAVVMALGLVAAAPAFMTADAEAKTPGSTYCFYKTCHRVKTLAETRALIGRDHTLPASFYDDCKSDRYNPCGLTSSGEKFRPQAADNAASPIYPDGTKLLVWSPATGQAIVLRINNAGPYWGNRTLDVSRAAAEKLGFKARGVANLKARIIEAPTRAEATYRKNRNYAPVPGHIGRYETVTAAAAALTSMQSVSVATLAPINGGKLPGEIRTDVVPTAATLAVASAAPATREKIPAAALADAKALVAFAWPVVSGPARKTSVVQTAALIESGPAAAQTARRETITAPRKRAETFSQRTTKARLNSKAAKSRIDVKAKPASVKRQPERTESASAKSKTVSLNARQQASQVSVKPAVKTPAWRDAPNDMSVFSRHNPNAPGAKPKDASGKAPMKTGAVREPAARYAPAKTSINRTGSAKRQQVSLMQKSGVAVAWAAGSFEGPPPAAAITGQAPRLPSHYAPRREQNAPQFAPPVPGTVTRAVA